jgi:cell division protein FtsB
MIEQWPNRTRTPDGGTCYYPAWMFEQNFGSSATRWLKWFLAAMVVYAITTFWPEHRTIQMIGAVAASLGIAIARRQISKGRRGD